MTCAARASTNGATAPAGLPNLSPTPTPTTSLDPNPNPLPNPSPTLSPTLTLGTGQLVCRFGEATSSRPTLPLPPTRALTLPPTRALTLALESSTLTLFLTLTLALTVALTSSRPHIYSDGIYNATVRATWVDAGHVRCVAPHADLAEQELGLGRYWEI